FISALGLVARNERGEVLGSKSILVKEIAFSFTIEACACSQADLRIDEEDARCRYLGSINELLWELEPATRKVILRKVEWVAVHHFDWTDTRLSPDLTFSAKINYDLLDLTYLPILSLL
ncbi:hypothetical protein Gohar_027174, partial [Gossypium harknessii]|nr:hypothetical protein [Gossypium harknessii]